MITNFICPGTVDAGELSQAPGNFHILVPCVHFRHALLHFGTDQSQRFPAHDHSRPAHAVVFVFLQAQASTLLI